MSILFNNPLLGASGQGPSADLGDTIDQSLRFTGAQNLRRTFGTPTNRNIWTVSVWIKRAKLGSRQDFFTAANDGLSNATLLEIAFDGSDQFFVGKASVTNSSTAKFRDPSAWYHLVIVNDGTDIEQYVNNVLVSTWSGQGGSTGMNNNKEHSIGDNNYNGQTILRSELYMAAFHFIDGQAKDPTDFGKINNDGVWVPQDYSGTYGNNGFHLKFDSSGFNGSGGIGADHSGNGNDFTASGFDEADVALYSKDLSAQGGFLPNMEPTYAFNGSLSDAAGGATNGGNMTFAPSTAITVTSSVSWYSTASTSGNQLTWNGTTVNRTSGWTTISGSGELSASNSFQWVGDGSGSTTVPTCSAIAIDGTATANILVDNIDNDVDYLDTPTSNYAVINVIGSTNQTAEEANLRSRASGGTADPDPPGLTVYKIPSDGDFYFECITNYGVDNNYNYWATGFFVDTEDIDHSTHSNTGIWSGGIGFTVELASNNYNNNANLGVNAQQDITTDGSTFSSAICGVRIKNDQITITRNGAATNVTNTTFSKLASTGDGFYRIYTYNFYGSSDPNAWTRWNFGQRPYVHAPSGVTPEANGIQTNNLPEPTIKNGSDHFQAIIAGPDQGVGTGETGGNFSIFLTSTAGFNAANPPALAFDGSITTFAECPLGNNNMIWAPEPDFEFTGNLLVYTLRNGNRARLNGGSWVTLSSNAYTTIATGGGTVTTLEIEQTLGGACSVAAISANGNILVDAGPLAAAQAAFPNGLWWIKDRVNSNQHQLVDIVRGGNLAVTCPGNSANQAYVAPSGNSVAWCWNAPETFTPTVQSGTGITNLQGRRNVDAGFSIITFDGSASAPAATITHGLDADPGLVLTKSTQNTGAWYSYHVGAGTGYALELNTSIVYSPVSNYWAVDTANRAFGTGVNGAGPVANDHVWYCWAPVPGYSAFGSYSGNQSLDGPFIYTGFRPAFLLIKGVTIGASWYLYDTTRNTYNPATKVHLAEDSSAEQDYTFQSIDLLSNGFKIRTDNASFNQGYVYAYAAFAESPFGGENAPPATAR